MLYPYLLTTFCENLVAKYLVVMRENVFRQFSHFYTSAILVGCHGNIFHKNLLKFILRDKSVPFCLVTFQKQLISKKKSKWGVYTLKEFSSTVSFCLSIKSNTNIYRQSLYNLAAVQARNRHFYVDNNNEHCI